MSYEVRVQAELCLTCVFRPGNVMQLRPGRVKGMIRDAIRKESTIVCHERLGRVAGPGRGAVCRGFFDRYKTQPLQIAERIGIINYTPIKKGAS